jgi:hypothetical protein
MLRKKGIIGMSLLIVFMAALVAGSVWAAESKTIVGTVSDDGNIVDDGGKIYMIGDNDKAGEVSEQSGKKVEVTGMVEESSDGNQTIMIESYKIVE